jgi:hypothetical protein
MNILNYSKFDTQPYSEIGQSNPMRWMNLKPSSDPAFEWEAVSHWWKCKDFMNDAVTSWWLKEDYKIYGFFCQYSEFFAKDQQEFYFLLKNLLPGWQANMKTVNEALAAWDMPPITWKMCGKVDTGEGAVLTLPRPYLENTLCMSTACLYVRMANCQGVYTSLEEMLKENSGDTINYKASITKPLNNIPKSKEGLVFSYKGGYNCAKDGSSTFTTSIMHNCGVVNWDFT